MAFPPEVWDGVLTRLQAELPPHSVAAWLSPLVAQQEDARIRLLCPTGFHRDRVRERFLEHILRSARDVAGEAVDIELEVRAPEAAAESPKHEPPSRVESAQRKPDVRAARRPVTKPVQPSLPHSFESFVVGPCNALAREASRALASERRLPFQQLYLSAGPGLGKTHLAVAAAVEAKRSAGDRVLCTSADEFTSAFTGSIRARRTDEFKRRYRRGFELLVLEDVHLLQGKAATQLEFFHTVQHLLSVGGRLLLTGHGLPHELMGLDERVRSQLTGGFVAEIHPPDVTVRRNILRDKASRGGVRIPEDCLDVVAESVRGSVRELEGALIQVVATASLLGRTIDLALTREALESKLAAARTPRTGPDLSTVIGVVAAFFQTTPEALASRSRRRDVLLPRQLAMYLCHRHTRAPLSEIGRALGRDHPAVRNAIAKIDRQILERAPLRYQLEALVEKIHQQAAP